MYKARFVALLASPDPPQGPESADAPRVFDPKLYGLPFHLRPEAELSVIQEFKDKFKPMSNQELDKIVEGFINFCSRVQDTDEIITFSARASLKTIQQLVMDKEIENFPTTHKFGGKVKRKKCNFLEKVTDIIEKEYGEMRKINSLFFANDFENELPKGFNHDMFIDENPELDFVYDNENFDFTRYVTKTETPTNQETAQETPNNQPQPPRVLRTLRSFRKTKNCTRNS